MGKGQFDVALRRARGESLLGLERWKRRRRMLANVDAVVGPVRLLPCRF